MKSLPSLDVDVLVIGHGISGLLAGSLISSGGRRTAVIGSGTTSTALSTSCFLVEGRKEGEKALSFIRPRLRSAGLPLVGRADRTMKAISHVGSSLRCTFVPKYSALESGRVSVLGLIGHPDLDADLVSLNLRKRGMKSGAFWTKLPNLGPGASASQFVEKLGDDSLAHLLDSLDEIDCDVAFIPPLFSLIRYVDGMRSLQSRGRDIREVVTPLSIPGLRLQEALESVAAAEGVRMMKGREAESLRIKRNEALSVQIRSGQREQTIEFSNLIVASGDLTLFESRNSFTEGLKRHKPAISNPLKNALESGLEADGWRAASREGKVLKNVFVCGAALPGNNLVTGNGMMGAAGSAWKVSELILGGA